MVMGTPGRDAPAGLQQGAVVSGEPQGVAELMERTEAAWQLRLEGCADATAEARAALVRSLAALRAEYGDANYSRRSAIERELRALMRRHDALDRASWPGPAEPDADPFQPLPDEEVDADTAPHLPHGPVPLGPESSVRPRGGDEQPAPAHAWPVPLGPESAVRAREGAHPAPPPRPAPRPPGGATRPIPHGAPGPPPGFAPREDPTGAGASDDDASPWSDPAPGGWTRAWGAVGRWVALGRLAVRQEVLLRKREMRLAEVGVRVRQLEARGALAAVRDDAGIRARLAQVAQVDAELAKVRSLQEALGGR